MEVEYCDGYVKFVGDIGILGLFFGIISALMGILTLSLSLINQIQANISAYLVGIPTMFLTLLGTTAPPSLVTFWSYLGVLDVFGIVNFFAPLGDFINMTDIVGNTIGLIALAMSAFSALPEISIQVINFILGTNLSKTSWETYRCPITTKRSE